MKKKLVILLMCVSVSIGMLGCSGGDTKSKDNKQESAEEQTPASPADQDTADDNVKQSETGPAEQPKEEMPAGDYKDTGDGTMYIACADETSEDGKVPVIYTKEGAAVIMIEVNTKGFDGSKQSYIYVDGLLAAQEQLSDSSYSVDLGDDAIAVGTHKVEVMQYGDDEPTGEVVTYKSASYEVKAE